MNSSPSRKAEALIAFGANLGEREKAFQKAVQFLELQEKILEVRASGPVITKAVLGEGKNYEVDKTNSILEVSESNRAESPGADKAYLNAAIRVLTTFSAEQLHQQLIEIETKLGRQRLERWGSRTIDLDLLLFGDQKISSPKLTVPHPRMSFRQFVLRPALEIASDMVHPQSGMTISQLLDHMESAESLICLATDNGEFAETIAVACPVKTEIVEEVGQFMNVAHRAKLVVSCFDQSKQPTTELESLERFALNFAGPMLQIDSRKGAEFGRTELVAAVEAMTFESATKSSQCESANLDKQF